MAFKNVGTYNLDKAVSGSAGAANAGAFTMDAAGIASGQAFLTAELEKRDTLVRTPLTSFTYARDIPIRVGGGWAEFVSAMQVGYGITGGSGDNLMHSGGANGIPMVQADFSKGQYKTHVVAAGTRVMWVDLQRGNMTGRNMDSLLRDGLRLTYDKHMDENTYVGFSRFGTTGLLNNSGCYRNKRGNQWCNDIQYKVQGQDTRSDFEGHQRGDPLSMECLRER